MAVARSFWRAVCRYVGTGYARTRLGGRPVLPAYGVPVCRHELRKNRRLTAAFRDLAEYQLNRPPSKSYHGKTEY